jgi:hypothetical protein
VLSATVLIPVPSPFDGTGEGCTVIRKTYALSSPIFIEKEIGR